jgi:uncharacterized OsmC-like protein
VKITLLSEDRIRLEDAAGPLTIEAESAEMSSSPFHMVASGLATCIFSVLHSWASHAKLPAEQLAVEVGWAFAESPHRVGRYEVHLLWPGLPEARRGSAERAASLCAVHNTLTHAPEIAVHLHEAAHA